MEALLLKILIDIRLNLLTHLLYLRFQGSLRIIVYLLQMGTENLEEMKSLGMIILLYRILEEEYGMELCCFDITIL